MNAILERTGPAGLSPKKTIKPIHFFFLAPEAGSVNLMGDFNEWSPTKLPMESRPGGWWAVEVPLNPGHHEYLFVVDGVPALDPHATGTTRNWRYDKVSLIAVS
jgi:1,4-alpha-glucan branching enzyme